MLSAAVVKEFKLVFRDLHSLLVLFAMPAVFIVIMSLAMQDEFNGDNTFNLQIRYYLEAPDEPARRFMDLLGQSGHFQFKQIDEPALQQARDHPPDGEKRVYLQVPAQALSPASGTGRAQPPITIWMSPTVEYRTRLLITAAVEEAYAKTQLALQFAGMGAALEDFITPGAVQTRYLYRDGESGTRPTAVQQSVPAWLIFSMFFVVIPISTTLITERQQGTLARLKTMPAPMSLFMGAKVLPYLVINQLQLLIMLLVGFFVVPALGGDRLTVDGSPTGLAIMSLATGLAAIGYGMLVAVVATTTEQATAIGGVGNILLGAIGGIMVPKFIMPEYLQAATQISPMAWGLEGFLDILLRGGGVRDIAFEALILCGFGGILLAAALVLVNRRRL